MGLSSYGEPTYLKEMEKILFVDGKGSFRLDLSYLSYHLSRGFYRAPYWRKKFFDTFGPTRKKREKITKHHMDVAASAQAQLERVVFDLADYLYEKTRTENLCIAGGVGMNGVAIGKLLERGPFKHIYVPPVSSDNGLSLGGALYNQHHILGIPRNGSLERADWGTEYTEQEIEHTLKTAKLVYHRHDDIEMKAADLVAKGKIVGWFQGRMEYGARALGFRSILANPIKPDMKDIINKYVKFREEFRPFAPAVLMEDASKYFKFSEDPIPFMTVVVPVREEKKKEIPSVTHVDGTARVQTVSKENNLPFWKLISEFRNITGTPVVINTSFNVMGEPLVENPAQALRTFFSTGIDDLLIGPFHISKTGQSG